MFCQSWLKISIKTMIVTLVTVNIFNIQSTLAAPKSETIQGKTGGPVDSKNCGFVATMPSYTMSLSERIDYMRMFVEAKGGQPTLLIVGPKQEDRFCVLGDSSAGLNPEISGVWEPGTYQVYIGDRAGEQHQFILNISTEKN